MTNMYESDLLVDQYLLFHYGTAEDQLPYPFGPKEALFYPIRCVSEFLPSLGVIGRALEAGAIGLLGKSLDGRAMIQLIEMALRTRCERG